ncbi:pilus assembly protein [Rubrivivax gelatinosus]|uniref:pilus assembly protein n=1 Tax=Rubrivivax gelatinosus TaxID=28068 RepID=UPI00030CF8E4|nr:PilC/PilY family type IV pilus protein [Rubrivivax gelatinosus]MBG6079698.1 type IV pilus assembly protein PilY1 [Rubrivivax gelatinosus]
MKSVLQFSTSAAALAVLLAAATASATDIAELPLKASVLAKPNVIWGLDDSGSMDFEVMLKTNDGAFWWDTTNSTGYSAGQPIFYDAGTSSTQYRKLAYLFPNGSGDGERELTDSTNDHFAIMPSDDFAWLRSSAYNPLYYNPGVTYKPWSPAYIGSAVQEFGNATASSAKSHPLYASSMDLTTNVTIPSSFDSTQLNRTFIALKGMKIPSGARYCNYNSGSVCSSPNSASSTFTVTSSTPQRVWMSYYPATYYTKLSSATCPTGATCVDAPDGAKLQRHEIKAANYSTTAEYNAAIQNFANWFQYYRKRKLMLSAASGQVLESLTGLRMGVVNFNNQASVTMYDIDSTSASTNGRRLAGIFYANPSSGGTPTRETLKYIGGQFTGNSSVIQYACQRNNVFVVTDGFAYANSVSPPSYDQSTYGTGAPYETIYSNTLADLALAYYTINLNSTFATGKVPATTTDTNTNLHLNTYAMTLGAKGTIFVDENTAVPTTTSAWPNPSSDRSPTAVDDLWHATINGRGKMYTASTPTETAERIQLAMNDMLSAVGAQSGVAVSTVNLLRGDGYAYMATYNPAGWSGDLTANTIDATTAVIATAPSWSADTQLRARNLTDNPRQIATDSGSGGAAFTAANVGDTVNPSAVYGTSADLFAYLRGARTLEGTTYRRRTSLMGAVINAEPVISRSDNVVYLASGEGMLHAFDIAKTTANDGTVSFDGDELWAFVPNAVLPDIGQTAKRAYTFKTQLDGTPVIGKTGTSSKLLVAGMGAAGRNYYALDVSDPRSNTEANAASWVKWQFPGASTSSYTSKVGQTLGKPVIAKVGENYRVIVTSGYNATVDNRGRLFVLDKDTGAVVNEYVTSDSSPASDTGLAHVSGYLEDDGTVRYVYGGDLLGNVWRFDLTLEPTNANAVVKVAVLKDTSGNLQPVTAAPELVGIDSRRVVLIGTGRLLAVSDFGSSRVQTFYAIADGSTLGLTGSTGARASLVKRVYTRNTSTGNGAITDKDGDASDNERFDAIDWTTQRGWYMDLPAGEQANTSPSVAYGAIAFTTNVAGRTDCTASSWLYILDFKTGSVYENSSFVSTQISPVANASGVNAVVTIDGKVRGLVQTTNGDPTTKDLALKPTIPSAKNSWREVRSE